MAARITRRRDIRILQLFIVVCCVGFGRIEAQNDNFEFVQEPVGYDVKDGDVATLVCSVDDPTDVVFHWTLNGARLSNNSRRYMDGSSLQFRKVNREEDAGAFACVAENILTGRQIESNEAELNIIWISDSGRVQLKEPATENEIIEGTDVMLRCRVEGNPPPVVMWYKDSTQLQASERYDIRSNKLTIAGITASDSGVYACKGENRAATDGVWSSAGNFTLNVVNPNAPVFVVKPENLIVNRNEEASLHCIANGDPTPEINWYFDNDGPLINKTKLFIYPNGTLSITQIKPKHEGNYYCVAINSVGQEAAEASIYISGINDLPFLGRHILLGNESKTVVCAYPGENPGGRPVPTLQWLDPSMQPVPASGNVHSVDNILYLSNVRLAQAGNYTCKASNIGGEATTLAEIIVATKPRITRPPEDTVATEDQAVHLHCQAESSPSPTYKWMLLDEEESYMKNGRFQTLPNGTLQIRPVAAADSGQFQCTASTIAGSVSASAALSVDVRLQFRSRDRSQTLNLGQKDEMVCAARGKTAPEVWWVKEGFPKDVWPTHVNHTRGVLTFLNVTQTDAGNYTCYAKNEQGTISIAVSVSVAELPHFIMEPKDTEAYEGYSTMIHCQASGVPEPFITWKHSDKKKSSNFEVMKNGSLYFKEISVEDEGKYICMAGNLGGFISKDITLDVIRGLPPQVIGGNAENSPLMMKTIGIAVGCAAAYIILVVGLMLYCKNRRRKQLRANALRERKENGEAPKEPYKDFNDIKDGGGHKVENEMAMNPMYSNKRRGSYDKLQFPRHDLQTITMLGRGEFGEVFLAKAIGIRDGEQETVVVVKSLMTKDEDLQVEFKREIDMLSKLQNDHVVRLLGICKEADPQYMITEYLEWGDLKQFLKATRGENGKNSPPPLHLNHKISIINQVALGMEHLSNHRFIHKDLATRNCLVSPNLEIKISNLGLTKDVYNSEYYEYHQSLIPIRWLPPEAIFENEYSTKSDVWAFGVFMWEVFALGEMPFSELADEEVLKGLVSGEISLSRPSGCPEELAVLMHRCWEDSPKDRPSFSDIAITIGELQIDSDM
ncbi:inactive tyrosine-protein kinase 7-like [Ptychodera flava]|uniref:inactive tyrosine-protein kinase 7-like n=1 Tax=Ptychodera flava TaxID=63121 RepID=UPI00396A40B4